MPATYSGSIDWVAVYRQHYSIDTIEARLSSYLEDSSEILFAGFGEVANRLSRDHEIHYVEFSASMVDAARREFTSIGRITHGSILGVAKLCPCEVILITCRISAYWHQDEDLQRLINAVLLNDTRLLIIDFFDVTKLESTPTLGDISFVSIESQHVNEQHGSSYDGCFPTLVKVAGAYDCSDARYSFEETRAYYSKQGLLDAVGGRLLKYDVSVEAPIVVGDPGFTLVARKKERSG